MRRLIGKRRTGATSALPPANGDEPAAPPPLDTLPRVELYRLARERGVPDAVRLTREELIAALRGSPTPRPAPPPAPEAPVPADLDRLPRSALFELAQARGVANAVLLSRDELIVALRPEPAATPAAPAAVTAPEPDGLDGLSREQLFARARTAGIEGTLALSREQLIAALRGMPAPVAPPDEVAATNGSTHASTEPPAIPDGLDELPRQELFWLARRHGIGETLTMSRTELIAELRRAGTVDGRRPEG